jgi:hypothetical protein
MSEIYKLIFAMGTVLLMWLLLAASFTGIGLITFRAFFSERLRTRSFFECFWLGFAITLAGLQIWHLLLPVNAVPVMIVVATGVLSLIVSHEKLAASIRVPQCNWTLIVALLLVVWTANRCIGPARAFDTGYYNYPAVRWTKSYPVVPGLANLHDRLAFNNSSLLYAAMLDHGFWRSRSEHLANGLLLCALMMQFVYSAGRFLKGGQQDLVPDLFDVILFIPLIYLNVEDQYLNIASLTTDFPVIIVLFAAASMLFRKLCQPKTQVDQSGFSLLVIASLLATAITIKLSSLVFAVACSVLLASVWCQSHDGSRRSRGAVFLSAVFAILVFVPFIVHGVVLSGYPFYPSTFGPTGVDWQVPLDAGLTQQKLIRSLGRFYYDASLLGTNLANGPWLHGWLSHLPKYAKVEVVFPVVLLCVALVLALLRRKRAQDGYAPAWLLCLPCVASLTFWFYAAPTPRFGFFGFWILSATVLSISLSPYVTTFKIREHLVAAICILAFATVAVRFVGALRGDGKHAAFAFVFNGPGPDHGFYPFPTVSLRSFTTESGLVLLVPIRDGRVYDAPLLTTPFPEKTLRLRVAGDPGRGFQAAAKTTGITD